MGASDGKAVEVAAMTAVAFFNNKGGVGKTSLVYHLAWMCADLGVCVVAADLDPQANLVYHLAWMCADLGVCVVAADLDPQANLAGMFLADRDADDLWTPDPPRETIHGALTPLLRGTGDVAPPAVMSPWPPLGLVAGDLALSEAEDELSSQWPQCLDGGERAFRVITALSRVLGRAREQAEADLVLIDVGPNLGAINRAALIAADFVVVPLASDLFSLQGLRNLGPTLRRWRKQWKSRLARAREISGLEGLGMPSGAMEPIGYVVLQHAVRLDRPVRAYARWMDAIHGEYRRSVLDESSTRERRGAPRARYGRDDVLGILDAGMIAHVGADQVHGTPSEHAAPCRRGGRRPTSRTGCRAAKSCRPSRARHRPSRCRLYKWCLRPLAATLS